MMPISLQQLDPVARTKRAIKERQAFRASSPSKLEKAAIEAAQLSMKQRLPAQALWSDIVICCEQIKLPIEHCIINQTIFGRSLIERVIEAGDWQSCLVLMTALKNGIHADGRIFKDDSQLMTVPDEEGRRRGVKIYPNGAYYGGEFKNRLRHGVTSLQVV